MRSTVVRSAQMIVKSASAAFDAVRPPKPGLVVLAYHRVGGGTRLEVDLEPSAFQDQMVWLRESGNCVSLDEGLVGLAERSEATRPTVAVTFDDGTADFIDHALPALVSAGVPATYYIATDFIERGRPFPDDGTPMSWAALAEAVSTGLVTIGSHTHTHAVMDKLDPAQADDELSRAVGLIADRLGVAADHFAYPKGVFGGEANERVVADHHRSAAVADCGVNVPGSTNVLRLDRSPIQRSDGMHFFRRKVEGGLRMEGRFRAALNDRRYESATN